MSRIGRKVIAIPKGVTVTSKDGALTVKGPKGQLEQRIPSEIGVKIEGEELSFSRTSDDRRVRALHGLSRALANNMVEGVTNGYQKKLELVGVGYKAEKKPKWVQFALGYSHPVAFVPPPEITIEIPLPTQVTVSGIDKQLVGAVAAKIRSIRPPEPYKGKGVKYSDEKIRRKAGKTAGK
ncbi:MAG TPA: 50S ribosomal protein L6 [Candidatus Kapabacteria bacterium]|nr:50S ribosomal protein L6 [Candidatus Kapabacteria bacterium]